MEQHPVPRNISGFQFHLVGDMTLKQFGYLSGGIILAYLIYKFPLPQIISLPLAGITAVSGIAFAFVPIQERPLDRWLIAFIKSVYSPTQYLWKKQNPPLAILFEQTGKPIARENRQNSLNHQIANQRLNEYLSSLPQTLDKKINTREKSYVNKTLALFNYEASGPSSSPIIPAIPISPKISSAAPATNPAIPPIQNMPAVSIPTPSPKPSAPQELKETNQPENRLADLEKKLRLLLAEKDKITGELEKQKTKTDEIQKQPLRPVYVEEKKAYPAEKNPPVTQTGDLSAMPSIPTVGNVIIGIIRDNLKRLLPGIIVSVKDLSGMPVRALKTNKLGQFASATALANGNYIIEIEDPQGRFQFDLIKINLTGEIFQPIEVIAKGSREILRDKLTKELFGQNSI